MNDDPKKPAFLAALDHLDRDGLMHDCNNAIEQAVQQTMATGGKSKVTLVIDFARRGQNQIVVTGDVVAKLPKPKALPITLFARTNGELLLTNPDQQEFGEVVRIADHQQKPVVEIKRTTAVAAE